MARIGRGKQTIFCLWTTTLVRYSAEIDASLFPNLGKYGMRNLKVMSEGREFRYTGSPCRREKDERGGMMQGK